MERTINYNGNKILFKNLITGHHNIDKFIINNNLFSRPDHNFNPLIDLLSLNNVVYDIGAYIGTFSIPMALEGMRIYAFEGFPANYDRLVANCDPYSNIDCYNVAVHNKNQNVKTRFNNCTNQDTSESDITYVIFDEYLEKINIPTPDLVKVDIEGMETVALFGMTNLLENVRPIWQIGYHLGLEDKFEHYPGFVKVEDGGFDFETFDKLDYKVIAEDGGDKFNTFGDYICVPKEQL